MRLPGSESMQVAMIVQWRANARTGLATGYGVFLMASVGETTPAGTKR